LSSAAKVKKFRELKELKELKGVKGQYFLLFTFHFSLLLSIFATKYEVSCQD
jgi:hypothetical protein